MTTDPEDTEPEEVVPWHDGTDYVRALMVLDAELAGIVSACVHRHAARLLETTQRYTRDTLLPCVITEALLQHGEPAFHRYARGTNRTWCIKTNHDFAHFIAGYADAVALRYPRNWADDTRVYICNQLEFHIRTTLFCNPTYSLSEKTQFVGQHVAAWPFNSVFSFPRFQFEGLALTAAMGTHARLGESCAFQALPPELLHKCFAVLFEI